MWHINTFPTFYLDMSFKNDTKKRKKKSPKKLNKRPKNPTQAYKAFVASGAYTEDDNINLLYYYCLGLWSNFNNFWHYK